MNDRSSEQENYNELKFSREQGFFDKNAGIRLLIGFFFVLCFFALLHFREVRVELLELNSIASSYIVAQVDFDFFDEEATIILKQESLREIGKIYQISEEEIKERKIEAEKFLISNPEWRKQVEKNTDEEMYNSLNSIEKILLLLRFTDQATLHAMQEVDIPTLNYLVFTPSNTSEENILPSPVWQYVKRVMLSNPVETNAEASFIVSYFQGKNWTIAEDIPIQRLLRKRMQANVADKYTHVSAGSRLIDQGEKVTARHIAMLQAMKKALNDNRNLWHPLTLLGSFLLTMILTGICYAYFRLNHPKILYSNRKLFLLVTVVVLSFGLSKATEFFLLTSKSNLIEVVRYPLFVPFAAILLCSLINSNVATFVSAFLTIILTIALAFSYQGFMLMNISAALVAVLSTRSLKRRKEIFIVCGKAWLCCLGVILSIHFYQSSFWSWALVTDVISAGVFLLLTAVLVVGLLPLLESGFKIMTDVTLMEYMDPNNDLLRRLTIEAPGTYQHSVVVGNLAEAAASAIDANALFCRAATLYHDVGKMATPQYFTENQQGGVNIHQLLTPLESAQVIMAHVSEGVAMGRKASLPEQFIDIIKEHHGTTLVYYFYRKQLDKVGGDKSLVDERDFRYVGPKPRSKESAIIMIADSLEAASRSLDKITEETLTELASRLIREKAEDGQFDECLLTFEELSIVKSTLVKTLVAFGHSRIKYPAKDSGSTEQVNIEA